MEGTEKLPLKKCQRFGLFPLKRERTKCGLQQFLVHNSLNIAHRLVAWSDFGCICLDFVFGHGCAGGMAFQASGSCCPPTLLTWNLTFFARSLETERGPNQDPNDRFRDNWCESQTQLAYPSHWWFGARQFANSLQEREIQSPNHQSESPIEGYPISRHSQNGTF